MLLASIAKAPGERLRRGLDYSAWLADDENIVSATFTVTQDPTTVPVVDPVVVDASSIASPPTSVTIFVSGGDDDGQYTIIATITTDAGQIKENAIKVSVREPSVGC